MARRERVMRPGEAQQRRATFCAKLLGYTVVFGFLAAIVVGIPFPGIWQAVFVPILSTVPFVLIFLTVWFFIRMLWLRGKAKHYETLLKLETDPRFK